MQDNAISAATAPGVHLYTTDGPVTEGYAGLGSWVVGGGTRDGLGHGKTAFFCAAEYGLKPSEMLGETRCALHFRLRQRPMSTALIAVSAQGG